MVRQIIGIDEGECSGCGKCARACAGSALAVVNGTAKLVREDFCSGKGCCLSVCPENAISLVRREAKAYDESSAGKSAAEADGFARLENDEAKLSYLSNWPIQIKLSGYYSSFFENCDLLVAADCTAYCCADFHKRYIDGRVTIIGCSKLDRGDYSVRLREIVSKVNIKSVTLVRMDVPCCSGMEADVRQAIKVSGKDIPLRVETISPKGRIVEIC